MKRQTITLQIVQNGILIPNNEKIIYHKFYSVDNYKVINKTLFIEEFNKISSTYKINNKFLTDNISIIVDNIYTETDKSTITSIFKELSFNKIDFINITDIFKLKSNELLIDISTNHIKIYFNNQILSTPVYFSKYKDILRLYLNQILLKNKIKEVKLFGNNCLKTKLINELEKELSIKIYFYSHPEIMPIHLIV